MVETGLQQKPPQPVKHKPASEASVKLSRDIGEIIRRLRILEERYTNLRRKNQLTDQNMLETSRKITEEIRVAQTTLTDLRHEISEVNSKIKLLASEMGNSVPKRDFNLLSKYMDFWEPLNFLTREEANRIIDEKLGNQDNNQTKSI